MPESTSTNQSADLSEISAAAGIFVRPSETFAALVRNPTWWLPFVAGILVWAVFGFVMTDKVDFDASMRQAIEKRAARSAQNLSAAEMEKQVDSAVEMQHKMAPYYPTFGAAGYAF